MYSVNHIIPIFELHFVDFYDKFAISKGILAKTKLYLVNRFAEMKQNNVNRTSNCGGEKRSSRKTI